MVEVNKKGILISLGVTLLSLTVLLFASLILRYSESSEERLIEFSVIDRVYNLDRSIQLSIAELLNTNTDWNFNITPNRLIIRKTIFNSTSTDSNWSVLINNVTFLKDYLDSMKQLAFLQVRDDFDVDPKYVLSYYPINLTTIYRPKQSFGMELAFLHGETNGVLRYKLTIISNQSNGTIDARNVVSPIPGKPSINLTIFVNGTAGYYVGQNFTVDISHEPNALAPDIIIGFNRTDDKLTHIDYNLSIYTSHIGSTFLITQWDTNTWGIALDGGVQTEVFQVIADLETNTTVEKVISERIPVNTTFAQYGITQRSRVRVL